MQGSTAIALPRPFTHYLPQPTQCRYSTISFALATRYYNIDGPLFSFASATTSFDDMVIHSYPSF